MWCKPAVSKRDSLLIAIHHLRLLNFSTFSNIMTPESWRGRGVVHRCSCFLTLLSLCPVNINKLCFISFISTISSLPYSLHMNGLLIFHQCIIISVASYTGFKIYSIMKGHLPPPSNILLLKTFWNLVYLSWKMSHMLLRKMCMLALE